MQCIKKTSRKLRHPVHVPRNRECASVLLGHVEHALGAPHAGHLCDRRVDPRPGFHKGNIQPQADKNELTFLKTPWTMMANKYSFLEVIVGITKEGGNARDNCHTWCHRLPPAGTPEGAAIVADAAAVNANLVPAHLVDCCVDGDEPELLKKHQHHRNGHQQRVHGRHETQ